jgi:hypothetical protein
MLYEFAPHIQRGIEAGKYFPVFSNGVPLSIVRDASGKFAAHAVGMANHGQSLEPLIKGISGIQAQGSTILNSLQGLSSSVATLQATTAVIGVGTVFTAALTAVNLWQTLKLRQDVREMRLEVQDGFLDMKKALADQGNEIIQHIQLVAADVEFRSHRTILVRAYGLFQKALERLRISVNIQDIGLRYDEITAVRGMLFEALADYRNDQILDNVCAAARLRRLECAWAIEQAIAMTYQLQCELGAVYDHLSHIQQAMRKDMVAVVASSSIDTELGFLFPEITRLYHHDLAMVESWQQHTNWQRSLPPSELQQLEELSASDEMADSDSQDISIVLSKPVEYEIYEEAQIQSHPTAIRDSLLLILDPSLREQQEDYISECAAHKSWNALTKENLRVASPWNIANLSIYFKDEERELEYQ